MRRLAWLPALAALLVAQTSLAHKPSDSYLTLGIEGTRVVGRWDVALRDLELALGLDADGDGTIRWDELRTQFDAIDAFALGQLGIASGRSCPTRVLDHAVARHSDGAYAVLRFEALCTAPVRALDLDYGLFAGLDPQHRGLLRVEHAGGVTSAVLGGDTRRERVQLVAPSPLAAALAYGREGVRHVALGCDHVLFLLSLLLPVVLRRERGRWLPEPSLGPVTLDVLRVVSGFTVAHSLTLSLAALGVVSLPSRLVESAIAASVLLAAANNLRPTLGSRRWLAGLGFGLVHGLGFASVLSDLGLAGAPLVPTLLGFNLGVEVGQLALVAAFLPLAWTLRETLFYRRFALGLGSLVIAALGALWLAERSLDLRIL
jgi:hypothetical protein